MNNGSVFPILNSIIVPGGKIAHKKIIPTPTGITQIYPIAASSTF
jgi:hypothetical protein